MVTPIWAKNWPRNIFALIGSVEFTQWSPPGFVCLCVSIYICVCVYVAVKTVPEDNGCCVLACEVFWCMDTSGMCYYFSELYRTV